MAYIGGGVKGQSEQGGAERWKESDALMISQGSEINHLGLILPGTFFVVCIGEERGKENEPTPSFIPQAFVQSFSHLTCLNPGPLFCCSLLLGMF